MSLQGFPTQLAPKHAARWVDNGGMSAATAVTGLLLVATLAMAQSDLRQRMRESEDKKWAAKSGLSVADVSALRTMAGIANDAPDGRIGSIDAASLASRGHILLTEAGNGHCMRVHVFAREKEGFREVWLLSETPQPTGSRSVGATRPGGGICSQAPRQPSARVAEDGSILVEVPVMSDPFQRSVPVAVFPYEWNGKTYALSSSKL